MKNKKLIVGLLAGAALVGGCCLTGVVGLVFWSGVDQQEQGILYNCGLDGAAATLVVCHFENPGDETHPGVAVQPTFTCDNLDDHGGLNTLRTIHSGRLAPHQVVQRTQPSPNFRNLARAAAARGPRGWAEHCVFEVHSVEE